MYFSLFKRGFALFSFLTVQVVCSAPLIAHCGFCEDSNLPPTSLNLETGFEQVRHLREQINLYNLINGLQLGRNQILDLLKLAEEADRLRKEHFAGPHAAVKAAEETFADVLRHLENGRFAPKEIELMAQARETQFLRFRRKYFSGLNALEAKVWDVLTPAQRVIVKDYRECLIPQADVKNPVNLGQAETNEQLVDLLLKVHALPEKGVDVAIDQILNEMFVQMDKKLRLTDFGAADKEKARIKTVLLKARSLSPVDMELQKADLAKEVTPRFFAQMHIEVDQFQEKVKQVLGGVTKIGKQFLHPRVIPILRARLNSLTAVCELSPKDLKAKTEILGTLNQEGKPSPAVAKVAEYLGLNETKRKLFTDAIIAFQRRALKIFMTKNDKGASPFLVMMRAKAAGIPSREGAALLHQAFVETFPDKQHSFFEELISEKLKTYSDIRKNLTALEFARLSELDIDLMDVRTGFEMGKGTMSEGAGGNDVSDLGEEPNLVVVAQRLHLDQTQSERLHAILLEHQKCINQLFRRGEPGKTPFDALLLVFQSPGNKETLASFLETLQNRIGSGTETYLESMLEQNRETTRTLEKSFPPDVFQGFAYLNLDLMKIKTGYNALTDDGCSWEDLEFLEKGDRVRNKHGIGKKTTIGELFTLMNLQDAKLKEKVTNALQDSQKKAFALLSQPGVSGEAPIDKFKLAGGAEGMKAFFVALMGKVKDKETTFMKELEALKRASFVQLKDILPNASYKLFRSLNLDLLDIDTGYNIGLEVLKRKISSWW